MGCWRRRREHGRCAPAGHVLDLLLAQILEDEGQPVTHLVVDRVGDEHAAGIGQAFDPCSLLSIVASSSKHLDRDLSPDLYHRLLGKPEVVRDVC